MTIANKFNELFFIVGARAAEASASLAATHDLAMVSSPMEKKYKIHLNQITFIFKQSLKMKSKGFFCPFSPTRLLGTTKVPMAVINDPLQCILPALTDIVHRFLLSSVFPVSRKYQRSFHFQKMVTVS